MSDSAIDYKDTLSSAENIDDKDTLSSVENRFYLNSVKERNHSYCKGITGFCSRLDWQLVLVNRSNIFISLVLHQSGKVGSNLS